MINKNLIKPRLNFFSSQRYNMELPFSPTKDLNLIQRNIKNPKNIKIKSKRYLLSQTQDDIKEKKSKLKRVCK